MAMSERPVMPNVVKKWLTLRKCDYCDNYVLGRDVFEAKKVAEAS
jgi:hypothetical protein